VALMFASDGTQLTAFSDAKLWPLYLGVGNESKYRRTKPSCQAFEHIAYFETVSTAPSLHAVETENFHLIAPRCLPGVCSGALWGEGTQQRVHGTLSTRDVSGSVGDCP
jgi:hypothetical protein